MVFGLENLQSDPSDAVILAAPTEHTVTIVSDETWPPLASFVPATSATDDEAAEGHPVTVRLELEDGVNLGQDFAFYVDTTGGTATAEADYLPLRDKPAEFLTGSVAGSTTTVALPVLDDLLVEGDETAELELYLRPSTAFGEHGPAISSHTVTITDDDREPVFFDFGDAPDSTLSPGYPTLYTHNGARHAVLPEFYLGSRVDTEADGQPTALADGDDRNPTSPPLDDEDGVVWTGPLVAGGLAEFDVTVTNGTAAQGILDVWIDLDRDASFTTTAQEHLVVSQPVGAGVHHFALPLSLLVQPGETYARFRLSTQAGLGPDGPATAGEVEDHLVEILPNSDVKWLQRPDLTTGGIDIRVDNGGNQQRVIADDFLCVEPGLLTDVHFWGSWLNDAHGQVESIHLSVHSDDPVGTGGTNPDNEYSQPDQLLWEADFGPDTFREQLRGVVEEGEYFWDLPGGQLVPRGDQQVWEYTIDIDPATAFLQKGSKERPAVYWLDVSVDVADPGAETQFGWKTRAWPEHFQDDAVYRHRTVE